MSVDVSSPTFSARATSRTPQAISLNRQQIKPRSAAQVSPHVGTVGLTNEPEQGVRPADGAAIQHRVSQDVEDDDDPEDLYGPPVERRVIRILPSLAEELRDQRRRAAAGKVTTQHTLFTMGYIYSAQELLGKLGRAPLAPDWIFARHVHDPLWKEIRPTIETKGWKRRKPIARKLGDNGLNVNELVACLHKKT